MTLVAMVTSYLFWEPGKGSVLRDYNDVYCVKHVCIFPAPGQIWCGECMTRSVEGCRYQDIGQNNNLFN